MIKLWQQGREVVLLLVRIIWRIGLSLLLFVLVLVACGGLYLAYTYYFGFDKARWAASAVVLHTDPEDILDSSRQSMVQDVLAHELRPGMSRAAVLAVLGPADYNEGDDQLWSYDTGWSGIDPTGLVIEFSDQGAVVRAYTRP
jgi:hypothetical protein